MSTSPTATEDRAASTSVTLAHNLSHGTKKKVRKACDKCRLKKSRCDGFFPCSRCKAHNFVCCYGVQNRVSKRTRPKGYVEMLENQQDQLVWGLQEMYHRLHKASLWDDEPLEESGGQPLTHGILAALGVLPNKPNREDSSCAPHVSTDMAEVPPSLSSLELPDFTGQPEAISNHSDNRNRSRSSESLYRATLVSPNPSTHSASSQQPNASLSPMDESSDLSSEQLQRPEYYPPQLPRQPIPPKSLRKQASTARLLQDSIPCSLNDPRFHFPRSAQASNGEGRNERILWGKPAATTHVPPADRLLALPQHRLSAQRRSASIPQLSLCCERLGSGFSFDSTDFMSDFNHLSPLRPTDVNFNSLLLARGSVR